MRLLPSLLVTVMAVPAVATQVALNPVCSGELSAGGFPAPFGPGALVSWDEGLDCLPTAVGHALYRYDLASQIPPGSVVHSVTLTFTSTTFNAGTFELHALSNVWTCAPLTWTGPLTGYGAPVGATLASFFAGNGSSVQHSMGGSALAATIQAWVDQPAANTGLMLTPALGACDTVEAYLAVGTAPVLAIDFDPPCPAPVSYCIAAPNSVGPGAHVSISGSTRIADDSMSVVVHGVRPGAAGVVFFGGAQQQTAFGNGFLCAGAPVFRLLPGVFADTTGTIVKTVDFTHGSAQNITAGSVWNFQCQYRDVAGGGAGFNFTDGVAVTFCP